MNDKAEAAVSLYLYKPHREAFEAGGMSSNEMYFRAFLYHLRQRKKHALQRLLLEKGLER
jgi:hypothetical protein